MGKVEPIRKSATVTDDPALAEAQENFRISKTEVATLRAAVAYAEKELGDSRARLEYARAGIERAKETEAAARVEAAISHSPFKKSDAMREMEQRERDAMADIEAATAACADLQQRLEIASYHTQKLEERLRTVLRAAFAKDAASVFAEARQAQDRLNELRLELRAMVKLGTITGPETESIDRFLKYEWELPFTGGTRSIDWDRHPVSLRMERAFKALLADHLEL
jgi:chromosome segregation ATPase